MNEEDLRFTLAFEDNIDNLIYDLSVDHEGKITAHFKDGDGDRVIDGDQTLIVNTLKRNQIFNFDDMKKAISKKRVVLIFNENEYAVIQEGVSDEASFIDHYGQDDILETFLENNGMHYYEPIGKAKKMKAKKFIVSYLS